MIGLQGAQGVQGQKGNDGAVGPNGLAGLAGVPGPTGPQGGVGLQGAQGVVGPQGAQGIQGVPGMDCVNTGGGSCDRYANVYSTIAQVIGAYSSPTDQVNFDSMNSVSTGDFDLTQFGIGKITFLKHGIYHIQWQLQARITAPVPNPVPSWSFGFWINGVLVPGSIYSGFTQAPGDDACHSTGDVIIEVKAGDVLMLRNTSASSVNLNPNVTGSVFPITIASVNIECMKALA